MYSYIKWRKGDGTSDVLSGLFCVVECTISGFLLSHVLCILLYVRSYGQQQRCPQKSPLSPFQLVTPGVKTLVSMLLLLCLDSSYSEFKCLSVDFHPYSYSCTIDIQISIPEPKSKTIDTFLFLHCSFVIHTKNYPKCMYLY